ncbi:phosphoglycerate mutase-like protein [Epithele typhae]|uniref:phosphoglycerate mutase-like protein n=1 Tax=Epithele typhae TaxID=378194 RepID=UPI002007D8D0|nr:phosphoglycerate mutase-like protein [Epithele typhae]KAH9941178.1 phosphoglycerate mutase-like protein [Epithele typhae]
MATFGGGNANDAAATTTRRGSVPLDVDGYPVAPPGLELTQVHIYVRHELDVLHTARQLRAAVASTDADGPGAHEGLPTRRVVERADGTAEVGECLLGELTDVGRSFGSNLRKLYVDRLRFLPDVVRSNDQVYLRSTNMPRTIESLQQIVHGLYPAQKTVEGYTPHIRIRNAKDENLFGNTNSCKRLQILQIGFAQAAAAAWNKTLEPLDKKISKYIDGNPVRLDGKPRASGILDTIRAADAHNVNFPPEFKEKGVLDVIEKAVVTEWFAGYGTEEVRRLGMGPLLSDLSRKMQVKTEKGDADPAKILVHSTHDTCLAALVSTLESFDNKWPAFTAAITFELFKKREDPVVPTTAWQNIITVRQIIYVRVRYQNRNLPLPMCAEEGKHLPGSPEFCTFAAFRERVKS